MKLAITISIFTILLTSGCAQTRMTQFDYGDIHLQVGARVTQGQAVAMADYKPGVYYCPDPEAKQVLIEVKLVEIGRRDMAVLGVDWFNGLDPLIAASDIENTTPENVPMAMGGLVNVGIGGGRGRGGCPHGPGCRNCGSGDGGVGGGINFPVITGREGSEPENVTSVRATFDLDSSVEINRSYLAITLQIGRTSDNKIIVQPMLLPVIEQPKEEPPTPPVRRPATTVLLRDDQTVLIGGLLDESEEEVMAKTPILGDIPLLGSLFKNKTPRSEKRNLIIFVTPHIIAAGE